MTELQRLEDKIGVFQAHLNDAWRSLSSSSLTPFERRELRNEMKRCGSELQRCLQLVQAEHGALEKRAAAGVAGVLVQGHDVGAVAGQDHGDRGHDTGPVPALDDERRLRAMVRTGHAQSPSESDLCSSG